MLILNLRVAYRTTCELTVLTLGLAMVCDGVMKELGEEW